LQLRRQHGDAESGRGQADDGRGILHFLHDLGGKVALAAQLDELVVNADPRLPRIKDKSFFAQIGDPEFGIAQSGWSRCIATISRSRISFVKARSRVVARMASSPCRDRSRGPARRRSDRWRKVRAARRGHWEIRCGRRRSGSGRRIAARRRGEAIRSWPDSPVIMSRISLRLRSTLSRMACALSRKAAPTSVRATRRWVRWNNCPPVRARDFEWRWTAAPG